MKKMIALLLAICMMLSMFAGCGNKTTNEETEPQAGNAEAVETQAEQATPAVALKNVDRYPLEGSPKLTIGVSKDNAHESELFSLMAETVGVDPEYQVITNEQAPLLFAGDTLPDLIFTKDLMGMTIGQINEYGAAGMLVNFAEYLDQMPNLKRVYEENPLWFTAVMNYDGSFYTIPKISFTLTNPNNFIYYRTDHMAQAGWETAPSTPEEFAQYLRDLDATFGANDPDYIPFTCYSAEQMDYNAQLSRALFPVFGELMENNITVDTDGKTIVAGFTTEQYQRYLKYVKSLIDEGLLDPNCLTANMDLQKAFQTEGHTSVSTQMTAVPKTAFASGIIEESLFVPFTSEYSSEPRWAMPNLANVWGGMISTKCENLDAALAYIDACYAPADDPLNEEGTVWGISWWMGEMGVAWEWIEEGVSYERPAPEGYASASAYSSQHGYSDAPFVGYWDHVQYEDGVPRFKAVAVKENQLPYAVEIIRPENLTLDEEGTEVYNDTWPEILTYLNQMNAAFLSGEADIDADFASFVANLEAMGLQDVIDVYQAALDRYLAK